MATATMVKATRQHGISDGSADSGRGGGRCGAEVIIGTIICRKVRKDVITIGRRNAKTLYVLAKQSMFLQNIKCFGKT